MYGNQFAENRVPARRGKGTTGPQDGCKMGRRGAAATDLRATATANAGGGSFITADPTESDAAMLDLPDYDAHDFEPDPDYDC